MCRPKHVEPLRNIGVINSTTRLQLVSSFYEAQKYIRVSTVYRHSYCVVINRLNAELIPICHLLAWLGAYHIFHVSRIRVKLGKSNKTECLEQEYSCEKWKMHTKYSSEMPEWEIPLQ